MPVTDPVQDALYTVAQLSERLNRSKVAVYREYKQLGIPYIRIGGSVRFRASSVERWLESQEVGAA